MQGQRETTATAPSSLPHPLSFSYGRRFFKMVRQFTWTEDDCDAMGELTPSVLLPVVLPTLLATYPADCSCRLVRVRSSCFLPL